MKPLKYRLLTHFIKELTGGQPNCNSLPRHSTSDSAAEEKFFLQNFNKDLCSIYFDTNKTEIMLPIQISVIKFQNENRYETFVMLIYNIPM